MKRLGMMLSAALLFSAVRANAQVKQGSQEAGADVGLGIPMSDTTLGGDIPSTTLGALGAAFGVNYDYMVLKNVSVGGDFGYRNFGNDTVSFHGNGGTLSAYDWTMLATGKFQLMPDNQIRPYGLLGLGFGHGGLTLTGPNGGTGNGTGFAYAFGAGAEGDLNSQWAVGAELRWTGLSAGMNNALGTQNFNSLDFLVSVHFKPGS